MGVWPLELRQSPSLDNLGLPPEAPRQTLSNKPFWECLFLQSLERIGRKMNWNEVAECSVEDLMFYLSEWC